MSTEIVLGGTVVPGGPFPIAKDTDLLGGLRVVADITARNAILTDSKVVGMFVQVQSDGKLYRLMSTGPDVWAEFTGGGGGSSDGRGPDIAIASNITIPGGGNTYQLTGTGTVNLISRLEGGATPITEGTRISLVIPPGGSITHAAVVSGDFRRIFLCNGLNFDSGSLFFSVLVVRLVNDAVFGDVWVEDTRSTVGNVGYNGTMIPYAQGAGQLVDTSIFYDQTGHLIMDADPFGAGPTVRVGERAGADIASATNIELPATGSGVSAGNVHSITGTVTIDRIRNTSNGINLLAGMRVSLFLPAGIVVRNNIANSGTFVGIRLAEGQDLFTVRSTLLPLRYMGATNKWVEDAASTPLFATWTASPRYFAIDYDGGNDANAGFSDVSAAAAGLVAKKTWEGLQAILPIFGNGRRADIIFKTRAAGAAYRNAANTADAQHALTGYSGYARLSCRGTATVTSAGSTAFLDDANDQICAGGIVPASANAAGYRITRTVDTIVDIAPSASPGDPVVVEHPGTVTYTTGERVFVNSVFDGDGNNTFVNAPGGWLITVLDSSHFELQNSDSTTFPFDGATFDGGASIIRFKLVKADGSAAALPSDATARMWRLRGDVANTTVANRNLVLSIRAMTTDTMIFFGSLVNVNATTDFWYIEQPGVLFNDLAQSGDSDIRISGIRYSALLSAQANPRSVTLTFSGHNGNIAISNLGTFQTSALWTNNAGTNRTVGPTKGLTSAGTFTTINDLVLDRYGSAANITLSNLPGYRILSSVLAGATLTVNRSGQAAVAGTLPNFDTLRILSRIQVNNGNAHWQSVHWEGNPNLSLVLVLNSGGIYQFDLCYDSTTDPQPGLRYGVAIDGAGNKMFAGSNFLKGALGANAGGEDYAEIIFQEITAIRWRDLYYGSVKDALGCEAVTTFVSPAYSYVPMGETQPRSNDNVATIDRFALVRQTDGPGAVGYTQVGLPQADSAANVSGPLMVAATYALADGGLFGPGDVTLFVYAGRQLRYIICDDAAPAIDAIAYISTANAGRVQTTVPAVAGTNQKRRVGHVVGSIVNGALTYALIDFDPEAAFVVADGNP